MELGLSQHQALKQVQTLSPQMYMSMEILCMNALDLEERVETELQENETLEVVEPSTQAEEGSSAESGTATADGESSAADGDSTASDATASDSFEERFERWDQYSRDELSTGRSTSSYRGEKDEKLEAISNTEDRPLSLQEHLEHAIHLLGDEEIRATAERVARGGLLAEGLLDGASASESAMADRPSDGVEPGSPAGSDAAGSDADGSDSRSGRGKLSDAEVEEVRHLCDEIIYNIDNRGYLMYPLEEIQEALDPPPPMELLRAALGVVQDLEPPGVGGRGLQECLLLQLRRDVQDYPIEERIIRVHLDDLGHNRLPKIARALGIPIDEVKDAMQNIGSLDPLPGKVFGGELPRYVKPDVIVDEVEGRYEVRIENEYLPRLHVSPHYRNLYKESRKNPEVKKYLKKKMDSAEWLMSAIRQRQSTLQKIAIELVGIQHEFLDHGIAKLRPLKMAEVADRLGVHVSTVSRAIHDKYMQTPRGIYPMKFFFTGGATKSDGEVEARGAVIQRIKDLIAEEDKNRPLSDISIVKKLKESGISISRRTVTKYREAEGIKSSRERREY